MEESAGMRRARAACLQELRMCSGFVYKLVVEESDKEKFERRRSVETKVCILAKDTRPEAKRLFEELPLPCNSVSGVRQYALVS